MQNLKYVIYDESHRNKLRSTFYREFIFMTYLGWADHQCRHVERHYLPQIDIISSKNKISPPHIAM